MYFVLNVAKYWSSKNSPKKQYEMWDYILIVFVLIMLGGIAFLALALLASYVYKRHKGRKWNE